MSWHANTGALLREWSLRAYGDPDIRPDKYIVVDLETTGLDRNFDKIAQIGTCVVSPGVQPFVNSVLLKVPIDEFSEESLAITGITQQMMDTRGVDKPEAMHKFYEFLTSKLNDGYALAGHNITTFDLPFLINEFARYGHTLDTSVTLLDTGLLCKAAQLNEWPQRFESLWDFFHRVYKMWSYGAKWNLSPFCVQEFRLTDIDSESLGEMLKIGAHDAGVDCINVHLLIQRYKEYAEKVASGELTIDDQGDPQLLQKALETLL